MADSERLPRLWRSIEEVHRRYVHTDDSPEKLVLRKKLDGHIEAYLCVAAGAHRYGGREAGAALARCVQTPTFSAYRAARGFDAVARYAQNLIAQPHRTEFATIAMYSGFYVHEVDANLPGGGAVELLLALGYAPAGRRELRLRTASAAVTRAAAIALSRDALIAVAECQLMCSVWELVWRRGGVTSWRDVWTQRARAAGDVAAACAALQHPAPLTATPESILVDTSCTEPYSNMPFDPRVEPVFRNQAPIQAITSRPQLLTQPLHAQTYTNQRLTSRSPEPSEAFNQSIETLDQNYDNVEQTYTNLSPTQDVITDQFYPMCPPYLIPQMYPNMMFPMSPDSMPIQNGIPLINPYMPFYYPYMYPAPYFPHIRTAENIPVNGFGTNKTVPTAKLIELDEDESIRRSSRQKERDKPKLDRSDKDSNRDSGRSVKTHESRRTGSKSALSDVSIASLPRSDTQPSLSKAKEDGMGTYESWDYVFRNLSRKDDDQRSSRLSPPLERDARTLEKLKRDNLRPTTLDLEDGLQALTLDRTYDEELYRTAKINEDLLRMKQESELKKMRQLKRQEEKRNKMEAEKVIADPEIILNSKITPDKTRLLTKQDVKDRKDAIRQSAMNGFDKDRLSQKAERDRICHVDRDRTTSGAERDRSRKPSRVEDRSKLKPSIENGMQSMVYTSKAVSGETDEVDGPATGRHRAGDGNTELPTRDRNEHRQPANFRHDRLTERQDKITDRYLKPSDTYEKQPNGYDRPSDGYGKASTNHERPSERLEKRSDRYERASDSSRQSDRFEKQSDSSRQSDRFEKESDSFRQPDRSERASDSSRQSDRFGKQSDSLRQPNRSERASDSSRQSDRPAAHSSGTWECGTCTYVNSVAVRACDMCGKSRAAGAEATPLTCGGRECRVCTLVNRRDAAACDACGTPLQHCPTYI